jgi:hypothetical protein
MAKTPRDVRIVAALTVTALVVWVLYLLDRSSWGRSAVSDYGTAFGPVLLFFVIPAGGLAAFWLRRRAAEPLSSARHRFVGLSAAFLAATWVSTWIPMIFWSVLFAEVAGHHWPINLREGPDTAFARRQFEDHFGFPPDGVSGLYARRAWEFGDGNTYRLKFQFQDPSTIEKIVVATGLQPVPDSELRAAWTVESEPPEWWPSSGFSGYDQAFQHPSRPRLWVDRASRTAYYRSSP